MLADKTVISAEHVPESIRHGNVMFFNKLNLLYEIITIIVIIIRI